MSLKGKNEPNYIPSLCSLMEEINVVKVYPSLWVPRVSYTLFCPDRCSSDRTLRSRHTNLSTSRLAS